MDTVPPTFENGYATGDTKVDKLARFRAKLRYFINKNFPEMQTFWQKGVVYQPFNCPSHVTVRF